MSATPAPLVVVAPLPRRVLAHVFFRSLFLQASWNRRGMQNLGFGYAIEPALRALYPDPEQRELALRRHLGFFNCHPYMAAAILGGAIHHEERVAAGLEPAGGPQEYKQTLQGPLAAIGDGFFWTALRPFFGALGAVGVLAVGLPAVVAMVLVYNVVHVTLRVALFRAGYQRGDALVPLLARLSLPVVADRLRTASAALAGVAAGMLMFRGTAAAGPVAGVVAALLAVVAYAALAKGARLLPTLYLSAAAGAGAAVLVARLQGSR
ncbi:MAG TPA: PTS system mannose/fructose/sorbose family transporter subunit IID [Anaeromyxobacter sp.]|nr:PTS system mannose/fructose/sorbose family transporter subunit IID [Anaeromyxobacter sp.]